MFNTILSINQRIQKEVCKETIIALYDNNLFKEYLECKSVKNNIEILSKILDKNIDNKTQKEDILKEYLPNLIPPGTKGVIRGNKFNKIIRDKILSFSLPDNFEIQFEKNCKECLTNEKPDWYIIDKTTNKVLIGMNQLDLWTGGHQFNRGFSYLNTELKDNKLICVVLKDVVIKSDNKTYKLFKLGFEKNNLCYITNLYNIIIEFFKITTN